jgi:hypothetical protein
MWGQMALTAAEQQRHTPLNLNLGDSCKVVFQS